MNDEYKMRDRALEQALELVRVNPETRNGYTADNVIVTAEKFLTFLRQPPEVTTNIPIAPFSWESEGPFDPPMCGGRPSPEKVVREGVQKRPVYSDAEDGFFDVIF